MNDPVIYGKALRLIFGRVALIFLLLMANLWRTGGVAELAGGDNPDSLLLLFSVTVALTVIYFAFLRLARGTIWQIRAQFVIDVASVTWLVMQTGDIISPYATLYIVIISVAGFFLGKTETLLLAVGCAVVFTLLSVMAANGILPTSAGDQPGSRILQIVGVNDVAILLVGLIAARLSERRMLSEELKHTEESFADLHALHERIVESIGSGLVTTDLVGRIYAFNHAAEQITGSRANSVIGKSIFERFGIEMKEHVEECLSQHQKGRVASVNFETTFSADGGRRNTAAVCTVVPLIGKTGMTTGLIVTIQDVTQMKALEESVRRSDRLAAVGRMAAGLAHEIRNPLGSMSSALQFLQERSNGNKEETALMNVVLRESDRMNNIITNFLAFARPSPNGARFRTSVIDVTASINDCMSLVKHSPEASDKHRFEIDADGELLIDGDETQLKQVCWNLARNALQSMPEGGTLKVRAALTNEVIRVEFSDTGVGMDSEIRDHMFEPFISGSGGTGLGLSIVYKIVQDHGGNISVESEPGMGTSITIEFPKAANQN